MPSHGYSDALTSVQHAEIAEQGTLNETAKPLAEAIANTLDGANETVLTGQSLGARLLPDVARQLGQLGITPTLGVGFETVGLERRRSLGLTGSFFITEWWRNRTQYEKNEDMQPLMSDFQTFAETLETTQGLAPVSDGEVLKNIVKKDPKIALYMIAGSPLAKGTGLQSIEQVLAAQPDLAIHLVMGGVSSICRLKHVEPAVKRIEMQYGGRLSHKVLPNDTHGIGMESQAPRTAVYLRKMIDTKL